MVEYSIDNAEVTGSIPVVRTKGSIKNKRGYERYKNNNPWVVWQDVNCHHASVAQQVEHWTENPGRSGSIPL